MVGSDIMAVRDRAARLSVAIGFLMLALKLTAYLLTASIALLSDALESVVHVGATLVMYWCLRIAHTPPDRDHPYGHGKVEYLSVGFEGGMVALSALAVWWEVAKSLWLGHQVGDIGLGMGLSAMAAVINLMLGAYLIRAGRRTHSSILVADGHHVLSDVYTSAGALVGIGLVWWTGRAWIDALTAVILACLVLWAGIGLLRQAVRGLMDQADKALLAQVVEVINRERVPEWLDCHNLRVRTSGDLVYIDFHLVVPAGWTVAHVHEVGERLEQAILTSLGKGGAVFVHLDHPERPEYLHLARSGDRWPLSVASATRFEAPQSHGVPA
jgi:cation diffusion facilitator family transporter